MSKSPDREANSSEGSPTDIPETRVAGRALGAIAFVLKSAVREAVERELAGRLINEKTLVRSLSDEVEDAFWKRLRLFWFSLAAVGSILAFLGYQTLGDVRRAVQPFIKGARADASSALVHANAAKLTASQADDASRTALAAALSARSIADEQRAAITRQLADVRKEIGAFNTDTQNRLASLTQKFAGNSGSS